MGWQDDHCVDRGQSEQLQEKVQSSFAVGHRGIEWYGLEGTFTDHLLIASLIVKNVFLKSNLKPPSLKQQFRSVVPCPVLQALVKGLSLSFLKAPFERG